MINSSISKHGQDGGTDFFLRVMLHRNLLAYDTTRSQKGESVTNAQGRIANIVNTPELAYKKGEHIFYQISSNTSAVRLINLLVDTHIFVRVLELGSDRNHAFFRELPRRSGPGFGVRV